MASRQARSAAANYVSGKLSAMILPLALAHAEKPEPYSPDFYVAIATVIPVLFLALALQGDTYSKLLTIHESAMRRGLAAAAKPTLRGILMLPVILIGASYAQNAALVILFAGLGGETAALWSLCYGRNVVAPGLVLAAAVTLSAGIGVTLMRAYAKALISPFAPPVRAYLNLLGSVLRGKRATPADFVVLMKSLDGDAQPRARNPRPHSMSTPRRATPSKSRASATQKPRWLTRSQSPSRPLQVAVSRASTTTDLPSPLVHRIRRE
jgi:hypothetical protein